MDRDHHFGLVKCEHKKWVTCPVKTYYRFRARSLNAMKVVLKIITNKEHVKVVSLDNRGAIS